MFYNKDISQCFLEFSSGESGLDEKQVHINRREFGSNELEEKKRPSALRIFAGQFKDLLVIILIAAALVSLATGSAESTIVILAVLILNAVLGTVQYIKADKSLMSLKKMSAPAAKVIRSGQHMELPASEVVCGDIIHLEAGDIVPADGRIIDSHSLKSDESSLTGESVQVEKNSDVIGDSGKVSLGDQYNMVFSGSLITYGRATALVTAVGSATELGKIAFLIDSASEKKTPLQVTMDDFSKKLSIIIILICLAVFGLNLYRGMPLTDSILFAVALAVAAIPEALSSVITISLAIGTTHMAKENAIVKKLSAVESLGCVSVICSDKTGTLTQNKMTVTDIWEPTPDDEEMLKLAAVVCNDTKIVEDELSGDPTETALISYCLEKSPHILKRGKESTRIAELPFDSDRKLMSTLNTVDGNKYIFTKGAPDIVFERLSPHWNGERERISGANEDFSQKGLRVLAFAYKKLDSDGLKLDDENNLEFLGLIAMMDPPRPESAAAVDDCIKAGIKPVMITGDHKITATAIARKIGIMQGDDIAVTGLELDNMTDDELASQLSSISVYARVSPDNKIRIVKAWQSLAHIVAMTGDGVNDAPALKSADVGVAMGATGTEVAKDAASMILTDDNFATIIKAVLNGRNIYANIKNSILFLLSGNAAGIIVVFLASLLALPAPFTAVQLLFINLVTDSLPALAIGMEPSNPKLIKDKPRPGNESVLTFSSYRQIIGQGLLIGAATMAAYFDGLQDTPAAATTMAFGTLCLARLFHGFNCRGRENIFALGVFTNKYTVLAFLIGFALLLTVLMLPLLAGAFSAVTLSAVQLLIIFFLALAPTAIIQMLRAIISA